MPRLIRHLIFTIFSLSFLAGCGGGGGDGGGGVSISLNVSSLTFTAARNGDLPATQQVVATFQGDGVLYGVPAGSTQPSWISMAYTSPPTSNTQAITVSIGSTSINPGTYTTTLRFVTGSEASQLVDHVDLPVTYVVENELSVQQSSLDFNTVLGNVNTIGSQNISISGDGIIWTAAADQDWVQLDTASGTGAGDIVVSIDETGLSVGNHTATVTLTNTANDYSETVAVNLSITAPVFQLGTTTLDYSGINGAGIQTINLEVRLSNSMPDFDWSITTSDDWIAPSTMSGTAIESIQIGVNPAAPIPALASGTYNGTITFSADVLGETITETLDVSLTLTLATLTVSATELTFAGINGTDLGSQTLDVSVNTGAVTHPWAITLDSGTGMSWLQLDNASGSTSETPVTVTLSTVDTGLLGDVYPGSATVTVQVNGDALEQQIPVSLRLDPLKLNVPDNGVLLSSFPTTTSQLTHDVMVYDNAGLNTINWTASSDQSWLTVSADDVTGNTLTLTANPLDPNVVSGLNTAKVSISSLDTTATDQKIENTESITVGFYVGSSDPVTSTTAIVADNNKLTGQVADPVRPYVYVAHGGTSIDVYNVYSGALETTYTSIGGDIRYLAISSDGGMLYAVDHSDRSIVPVDLTQLSPTAGAKFADVYLPTCANCTEAYLLVAIDYTRINGYPVLVTSGNEIVDANNGAVLGQLTNPDNLSFYVRYTPYIRTSANGTVAIAIDPIDAIELARYELTYSPLDGGSFSGIMTHRVAGNTTGSGNDVTVNETGTRIYTAANAGSVGYYNGSDLSLTGSLSAGTHNVAVELAADGLLYASDSVSGIYVYDTNNAPVGTDSTSSAIDERQLIISGDSTMMVTRSSDGTTLEFKLVKP